MGLDRRFSLSGRIALVTGSTRGIGRALALALADQGADVVVHGAGDRDDPGAVAAAIAAKGGRAIAVSADFSLPGAARALGAEVARFGPVDILVLNASTEIRRDWLAIDDDQFDTHVAVNLRSSLHLLQAVVPGMADRGWGRVVALGSIQESKPNPRLLMYAALKSAQSNLIINLARQYAAQGVTMNILAPGAIATERNEAVLADAEYRSRVVAQIPARRIGAPEDCVGACLLLCSDAGAYITGSTIFVDGGWGVA